MSNVKFLLTTEVLGQKIQPVEEVANIFLTPARYLWNGRRVDFIQKASMKACQYDVAFKPEDKSTRQWVLMVILFVPGAVIGIVLKGYAAYKYHDSAEDAWIQRCLDQNVNGKIYHPKGDALFGDLVSHYIDALSSSQPSLADVNKKPVVFLSEIGIVYLKSCTRSSREHFTYGEISTNQQNIAINQTILSDISLLWRLSVLNMVDYYEVVHEGLEVEGLKALNPQIVTYSTATQSYSKPLSAQEFFANRAQQPGS